MSDKNKNSAKSRIDELKKMGEQKEQEYNEKYEKKYENVGEEGVKEKPKEQKEKSEEKHPEKENQKDVKEEGQGNVGEKKSADWNKNFEEIKDLNVDGEKLFSKKIDSIIHGSVPRTFQVNKSLDKQVNMVCSFYEIKKDEAINRILQYFFDNFKINM